MQSTIEYVYIYMHIYIWIYTYFSHTADYPTGWCGPAHVDADVPMHCKIPFSEGVSRQLIVVTVAGSEKPSKRLQSPRIEMKTIVIRRHYCRHTAIRTDRSHVSNICRSNCLRNCLHTMHICPTRTVGLILLMQAGLSRT